MLSLIFAILWVVNVTCFGVFNDDSLYQHKNCNGSLDNGILTIDCNIQNKGVWDLVSFRDWSSKLDKISSISVSINCNRDGHVFLQNPIRAKGLEKLEITECVIHDSLRYNFSETVTDLPDTLREFTMDSCMKIVDVFRVIEIIQEEYDNKVNKFYPCLISPSLRRYTERNEIVLYINTHASSQYKESDKARVMFNKPVCKYNNLEYYELTLNFERYSNQALKYFVEKSKLPALKVLNISHLELREIPKKFYEKEWWIWFQNLQIIDLSYNNFESINFRYSKPPSYSTTLTVNMTNNNISHITRQDLLNIKSFYPNIVNLRNNPLECTCNLARMMDFFRSESDQKWTSSYAYLNDANCTDQSAEKTEYMLSALNETILCMLSRDEKDDLDTTNFYLPLLFAIGVSLLCIIVVVIMIRCRTEIKILFHTRIRGVIPMTPSSPMSVKTIAKDFDAFVSYSSKDEQWVLDVMCKKLESSPFNFSLCLHHKHFVPGACIADNIIESIEKSRHTIMVLSDNFLKSEWCLLEFRKAFHQSLLENSHLIMILLDDPLCLDKFPDLKHCLNTRTYLKASETLFWDKLVYSISKRCQDDKQCIQVLSRDDSKDSSTTSQSIEETKAFLP